MSLASRSLTSSALNVFIHYYFSLPWLREYLLDQRVYWIIHYEEAEKEAQENAVNDENPDQFQQAMKKHRIQLHYDLLFLIRNAHKSRVTVELLYEIWKIITSLDDHRTLIARYRSYATFNSIHFRDAISLKVITANKVVSSYWKKVAGIPLEEQWKYSYFQEAKLEELKHLGYGFDADLEVINADVGKTFLTEWIETEYTFRVKLERMKSAQDQLKFYESLSLQAKHKNNLELCKRWEAVVAKEKEGRPCDYELLLAWSLGRVGKNDSSADQIWQLSVNFHQSFPSSSYSLYPEASSFRLFDAVRFMRKTEKTLIELTKIEKEIANTDCFHGKQRFLKKCFKTSQALFVHNC
jgi:hypothetical protein